jgi:hypothetical protein
MIRESKILKCDFCGRIDIDSQIGKLHEELGYCPFDKEYKFKINGLE